jgi:hypothetical protein
MKKKIIGISICMLMILTAFSAVATTTTHEPSVLKPTSGHRGGLFTQLPSDPGLDINDWFAYPSAVFCGACYQDYELFTGVVSPIQGIHWWGMSCIDNDSSYSPGDPLGMTFDIIFYEDNDSTPGEIFCTYTNIKPSITATGIMYPENPPFELYFFECNLSSSCNLSTGWISIFSLGSDNDCDFFWLDSLSGYGNAFETMDGEHWDRPTHGFSLVLTDGTTSSLEIVDITGGLGVTLTIKNTGDTTVDNFPVDFIVLGGILKKIEVNAGETISGLNPGDTKTFQTGTFFGLGKITLFAVGDGIITYKNARHIFLFTIIQ